MVSLPSASAKAGFFKPSELSGNYDPSAVGLSFSGGGYRATLFHAGALLRLNELGILSQASRIASVSGGSITTGILAMNWDKIDWQGGVAKHDDMIEHLIEPCLKATSHTIDIGVGILGFLPGISAGNRLAAVYDKNIFNNLKLNSITDKTRFIFCASNLQTGALVRFTRDYVADWRAFRATTKTVKLSEAVAASSGFPPILAPLRLNLQDEDVIRPEGARYNDPALRKTPILVDGGVYDNLGLEPIWKRCGILITSSAGQNNAPMAKRFVVGMMMRVVNTFLEVSIDWRERMLVNLYRNMLSDGLAERTGSYWTIATPTEQLAWDGYKATPEQMRTARDMKTRLKAFPKTERLATILAGYSYADGTVRKYLLPNAPAPAGEPRLP